MSAAASTTSSSSCCTARPAPASRASSRPLASHVNRDLYCLDQLSRARPRDRPASSNGILAIEDIDTLGALRRDVPVVEPGRTEGAASPKVLLHSVLNTLDGLATPHGLITIITTNHIAALDPALVRPCRIDLQLEVTALDYDAFREMFASYFAGAMPGVGRGEYAPQSGARLQEVFMGAGGAEGASVGGEAGVWWGAGGGVRRRLSPRTRENTYQVIRPDQIKRRADLRPQFGIAMIEAELKFPLTARKLVVKTFSDLAGRLRPVSTKIGEDEVAAIIRGSR